MKRILLIISCLFLLFSYSDAMMLIGGKPSGCTAYDCSGVGAFIWECNSTTVGDTNFCPYGCSDNDTSASSTGDVSIADGVCSFDDDDGTPDGNDYYYFDTPSTTLDDAGTVFVRFRVNTWVDLSLLFSLWGDSDDYAMLRLTNSNDINGRYSGDGTVDTVETSGSHIQTGAWHVVRFYWNNDDPDNDDLRVTVYDATGAEEEDHADDDDLTEFGTAPDADDLKIGNKGGANGADVDIEYIHIYEGWMETDPNG